MTTSKKSLSETQTHSETDLLMEARCNQKTVIYDELKQPPKPELITPEPKLTDESQQQESDINFILRNYQNNPGLLNAVEIGHYGDYSDAPSYQEAQNIIATANSQFELLPANVRGQFDNNPANFLAFATDPKNAHELIDMGLATKALPTSTERLESAITKLGEVLTTPSQASPTQKPVAGRSAKPKVSDAED